ncbi:MAG: BMP family ABC transporter substrate-binding protein [Coriobacteriales bacterium]|jgi:bmp family protein
MKKKFLTVALSAMLAVTAVAGLSACGNGGEDLNELALPAYENIETPDYSGITVPEDFKFGLICLHDESSTYDKNFIDAAKKACKEMGLKDNQLVMKTSIPELVDCKNAALNLVDEGCDVIFADSFGHEPWLLEAAKAKPEVEFCHATGTTAHTENLDNFHNAFASIYEGRYLAGVAAGMKLNEMIKDGKFTAEQAKIGYVGAFTYAEVISGYTAFYLGAKSVCDTVTMDVQFTGSWYDVTAEKTAAQSLIAGGCKLISQHADSMGAPSACEEAGVPNVSYNGSTLEACPETFIVSSRIDWAPYFKYIIAQTIKKEEIMDDYTGTIKTGSVVLTNVGGNAAAEGTVEAIVAARTKLAAGELKVFDTAKFTVTKSETLNKNATVDENGKLTGYLADVDTDKDFTGDTEAVINGIFEESKFRSAPYFDIQIDKIKLLNAKF